VYDVRTFGVGTRAVFTGGVGSWARESATRARAGTTRTTTMTAPVKIRSSPTSGDDADAGRGYDAAVRRLGETITGKKRADPGSLTWEEQFAQLPTYVARLGLTEAMDALRVIHVAGTKGKGSTCAMVERILIEKGTRVGTFTSPHLVDVRERFRIDGEPVDEETFAREFWWTHDKILSECGDLGMPAYFRFLTLLGLRIFSRAGVGACVLEVGLGGRLDATNVVRKPVVCGITSLGMDHTEILGDTISKIATEKAGIMKPGVTAFTSAQPREAMESLERRAGEVGAPLAVSREIDSYVGGTSVDVGLAGPHQRQNAGLAVALCREWANKTRQPWAEETEASFAQNEIPPDFARALAKVTWPGRSQVMGDPDVDNLTFYLDGAHTIESMRHSAEWFTTRATADHNVMLFNCMEERSPQELLEPVVDVFASPSAVKLEHAIFAPPDSTTSKLDKSVDDKKTTWQEHCSRTWDEIVAKRAALVVRQSQSQVFSGTTGVVSPSLQQALALLRRRATEVAPARVNVLVTGSLYLVGDVLRHLKRIA